MAKILVAYQISDNPKDFPFQMPEKGKVIDWCFCEEGKEYRLEEDHIYENSTRSRWETSNWQRNYV